MNISELFTELKNENQYKNSETGDYFHFQDYWDNCRANPSKSILLNGDSLLKEICSRLNIPRTTLFGNFSNYSSLTELEVFSELIRKTNDRNLKKELRTSYNLRVEFGIIDRDSLSFKEFFRGFLRMLAKTSKGISIEKKVIEEFKKFTGDKNLTVIRASDFLEGKGIDVVVMNSYGKEKYGSIKSGISLRLKNLRAFQEEKPVDFFLGFDEFNNFRLIDSKKLL